MLPTSAGWSGAYGAAGLSGQTLPIDQPAVHAPATPAEADPRFTGGSPHVVIVGLIGLLVLMWFVRRSSAHLQQNVLGINMFNMLIITITAIVGIVLLKMLFSFVPVPGVTPLLHAV